MLLTALGLGPTEAASPDDLAAFLKGYDAAFNARTWSAWRRTTTRTSPSSKAAPASCAARTCSAWRCSPPTWRGTTSRWSARVALGKGLRLPEGYQVVFGGQFEEGARSVQNLGALSALVIVGMYGLLFLALRSHRNTLIVLVNLPLALMGGLFALALGQTALSVASLVGFITLFGIAHPQRRPAREPLRAADAGGGPASPRSRGPGLARALAPVLMTAHSAGLALIPLILAGAEPGNETQSPMAEVILGGLLTSTFLNLVVVPILFARFGESVPGADVS